MLVHTQADKIPTKGTVAFKSYNIMFEFEALCVKKITDTSALFQFPKLIRYADRRKCYRLIFDTRENKIVKLWCQRLNNRFSVMIYDLCIDGIGFFVIDQTVTLKVGDTVHLDDQILGQPHIVFIKISHIQDHLCGGFFEDAGDAFKISLKKVLFDELLWRSEHHLSMLKEKSLVAERIQTIKEERQQKQEGVLGYLDLVNPLLESAITVLDQLIKLPLHKENIEFKTITSARYDATTFINCSTDTFQFQFFLCLTEESLLGVAERLTGDRPESIDDSTKDILGELGNMIVGNAKKDLSGSINYRLSTPGLIIGKRHVLSTLSRYPAIRIAFSSEIGPIDVVLFISDMIRKTHYGKSIDFSADPQEAMHFVEPIYNSTINLFSNFLNISLKEKAINMRNPLTPKFEVSAFLSIENELLEGQVVLNLSEKLARHIYKCLINEEVEELSDEVKDAVGEILNMITGNAKEEFSQSGLTYNLSTPFVVFGKDQYIKTIGDIPFVSSIYWTSEGFFELSFSLFKKKTN